MIKITPFDALEPYRAAADGPFSTLIVSISSWLISIPRLLTGAPACNACPPPELSNGTPSITNNGWLLPVNVVKPRIIMLEPVKAPPDPLIRTPGTLPASALVILV